MDAFNRMLDEIERSQRERADLLEREQEANRLKDEFLATLSHELRTPLNAIVGWVHLLRTGSLPDEERRHALERIDRNAHAQARLVQDLLDVSRITTGKLLLDIREMDFAAVVMNAIDACRPAADARQVNVTTQFSGAFPTCGDPDRLQQVVWNLITNAVRFTPSRRPRHGFDRRARRLRHARACAIPARASTRSSCPTCSNPSARPTRRAPAPTAASASA